MSDAPLPPSDDCRPEPPPRPKKRDVHGWVVLDKPVGMTSTHAVSAVKRALNAKKAGHAGTLDPLASGILPIALGEATKTVPFVMDGRKSYRFTIAWGVQTDTDDTEGSAVATSEARPSREAVEALLPRFTGAIMQTPPVYSAIKVAGNRAYDLAREGETVALSPREVVIDALRVTDHDGDTSTLEAECGKGTYVRAIARDMGLMLGCLGHVCALRRTRVGPFAEADAVTIEALRGEAAEGEQGLPQDAALKPVESGLLELPCVVLSRDGAARVRRGQSVLLRGRDAPASGSAYAAHDGVVVATGGVHAGEFVPARVFNLPT